MAKSWSWRSIRIFDAFPLLVEFAVVKEDGPPYPFPPKKISLSLFFAGT